MKKNSANKELYLLSSLVQDIKFSDELKNDLNDLVMMENLIKYFLNKQALTLDFIVSNKNPVEKIQQFIKMIDNIKVESKEKIKVFSYIINYLISLNNFDIKIIDTKHPFVFNNKPFTYDVNLNSKVSITQYRNKLYTDGTFKYKLIEDIQYIKCNNDCKYLMQVAVNNKDSTILSQKSWISINDFNLVLPSLEEIKLDGFPKLKTVNDSIISMDDINDLEFIEVYDKVNLEKYKTLIKK